MGMFPLFVVLMSMFTDVGSRIVATGYEGMHGEYTRVAQFLK